MNYGNTQNTQNKSAGYTPKIQNALLAFKQEANQLSHKHNKYIL